jgi:hypothetical protein
MRWLVVVIGLIATTSVSASRDTVARRAAYSTLHAGVIQPLLSTPSRLLIGQSIVVSFADLLRGNPLAKESWREAPSASFPGSQRRPRDLRTKLGHHWHESFNRTVPLQQGDLTNKLDPMP